jgi:hypothetical protein
MATDRDRFARVLDRRFRATAYAIATAAEDAVSLCVAYIELREREADSNLSPAFSDAHRVLVRSQLTLPEFGDAEALRIKARGRDSEPAYRLALAYNDVCNEVCQDLAETFARRQVSWVRGNVETYRDWEHVRAGFPAVESALVAEMTRRNRLRFLGLGEAIAVPVPRAQADMLGDLIPLR